MDKKYFLWLLIASMGLAFILGVSEFLVADSWVNGTKYIYPNSTYSDNIMVFGNSSGSYVHDVRLEGNSFGRMNRSMSSNGTYVRFVRGR